MKKFVRRIVAACLVLVTAFTITGCGFKAEKDYEFVEIAAEWASDETKQSVLGENSEEEYLESLSNEIKGSKMTFHEDGTATSTSASGTEIKFYYTETEETVELYKTSMKLIKLAEYKIDGKKLVQTLFSNDKVTVTVTYKR